jgi:hypothetical protein
MLRIIDEFGFEPKKFYTIEEYKSVNENYKPSEYSPILGIVEGKSFVLDGVSRNGRFYPKELWENALKDPEVIQMLNDKLMFGCIGHPENYTLDDLLAEGKVSHIVSDIRIGSDGFGYATYEILDTPAGRILNTVLRAGSKMKVSTRAFGEFVNEYKEIDGRKYQVINPKNFKLESIDFVIKPGIASVDVSLVEKLEQDNQKDLEKLKESKITLCEDGVCTIIEEVELYEKIKEKFNKELEKYKKIIQTLKEENKELQDKVLNNIDVENQSTEDIKQLLIAEIENYLRKINLLKNRKELTDALINFLESDEFKIEDLEKIKTELENVKSVIAAEIIKLINVLIKKLKEENPSKEDILKDFRNEVEKIVYKDQEELFKSELNKTKEKFEKQLIEYQETIKDLSKKLITLNKKISESKINEKELNQLSERINELQDLLEKCKKEKNVIKSKKKELEEENELIKSELNKLKIEFDKLKENFDLRVEKEVSEKLEEKVEKIKKQLEEEFKEKLNNLKETLKENFEKELNQKEAIIKKLDIQIKEKEEEIKSLKKSKITEKDLTKKIEEKFQQKLNIYETEINSIKEELEKYKVLYLKSLYKNLPIETIKETLNSINDIDKVKQVLEEKEIKYYNIPEETLTIVKKEKQTILAEKLL